jgi:hypothetical protein
MALLDVEATTFFKILICNYMRAERSVLFGEIMQMFDSINTNNKSVI